MKSGVNVAIVVNDAVARLIVKVISADDLATLFEYTVRTGERKLKKARKNLEKPKDYPVTLYEFCLAFPEHDPEWLAYRLWCLRDRKKSI